MDSQNCKITGEPTCACNPYNEPVFEVTPKETLRKLFSDHANYDNLYTVAFLNGTTTLYNHLADRMLGNAVDIGRYLQPIIGEDNGQQLTHLLQEHILSAGAVLKSLKAGKSDLNKKIQALYNNGDELSKFLSGLSESENLSYTEVSAEFQLHNQFVVDLGNLYWLDQYKKYIQTYDSFITHMLKFSDIIYAGFFM